MERQIVSRITVDGIEKIRRKIKVGDTLATEIVRYNPKVDGLIERIHAKVIVTRKYPYLVEVKPLNISRPALPTMTMTYTDIALSKRRHKANV